MLAVAAAPMLLGGIIDGAEWGIDGAEWGVVQGWR
jgi:hypothetical protein